MYLCYSAHLMTSLVKRLCISTLYIKIYHNKDKKIIDIDFREIVNEKIGFNCWRNIIVSWMWITKFSTIRRKTTDLREDNHQLKLDIQELNQQISDSKSKN